MEITINPCKLQGELQIIPSKSQAHRLLICAALASSASTLYCPETNEDIEATVGCLQALGANITYNNGSYQVTPIQKLPEKATLHCRESGSTLRFFLPLVGALGVEATFVMTGRLPYRPLSPLWEVMEEKGCTLSRPTETTISLSGRLSAGTYAIDGSISSQFITGLLFALSVLPGKNTLRITGQLESKPYVDMTLQVLKIFGITCDNGVISGQFPYQGPESIAVEGDWSNGAFFLAANTLGSNISIQGLSPHSCQGDRAIEKILLELENNTTIDATHIPDLVPVLAVVAASKKGASFQNIRRLRLKESDRVASVVQMLFAFGIQTKVSENTLEVFPGTFSGSTIDSCRDHRIAMAAAIAATVATGNVTILDAQCVQKSYPSFWQVYHNLGGNYEQHLR